MALSTDESRKQKGEVPKFEFATRTLPVREQFEAYRQTLAAASDFWRPDGVAPGKGFRSEFTAFSLGEMLLTTERHDPLEFGLTERLIRRIGLDHVIIGLIKRGQVAAAAGRERDHYGPGAIGCFSLATPSRGRASALEVVYLCIPRDALGRYMRIRGPESRLRVHSGLSQLLADHILSLERHMGSFTLDEAARAANASLSMVAACLEPSNDSLARAETTVAQTLRDQILRCIQDNLKSPSLSAEQLCGLFKVSRSSLYRLFESRGGVAMEIRRQRLEAAFRSLRSGDRRKLHQLAIDLGFSSPEEFSRAFRRAYGVSPREAASVDASTLGLRQPSNEDDFTGWLTKLMMKSR